MRHALRLSSRHRRWFYATTAVLFLSGAGWLASHAWNWRTFDEGAPNAVEPWLLKLHGAAAMATLVILGTLVPLHIRRGWVSRINRPTGAIMVGLAMLLVATGYGLYYAGGEAFRDFVAWVHDAIGLAAPLLLVWHIQSGRRRAERP